jgi:alginate O-acetyltransferase complex protein AlgI
MLFHDWTFALFLLIFYPLFLLLKGTRLRVPWLLLASYVFYGLTEPVYVLLILYSTSVDYLAVVAMARTRGKRRWLVLSIVNNLVLLGFFKYGAFVAENVNALLASLAAPCEMPVPGTYLAQGLNALLAGWELSYRVPDFGAVLPIGISFFVFRSMTYTIDYYRGNAEREPGFLHDATFVALFPQIMMGPIDRAKALLPQLRRRCSLSRRDVADGLSLFAVGLFKKVALADYLGLYVDQVYDMPHQAQTPALILATFAYAWQIYFDFSGYTDMARGLGRMIGIRVMLNFNNPYLATGLGDFWRRWHISLSTWFRDYLYIPLGGSRRGELRTYLNICLTMVVCGLWHGATWTFVIWGAVHAAGYCLTRRLERSPFYQQRVPRDAKQLYTFCVVSFAWIFFRAESLADAWLIVTRIFTSGWADPACPLLALILVFCVWLYQSTYESRLRPALASGPVRVGLVVFMVVYLAVVGSSGAREFIYLQF